MIARSTNPWRAELRQAFRTPRQLLHALDLAELPEAGPDRGFPMLVPRGFAARMRPGDPDDPLLRQVLPLDAEGDSPSGFQADPVGDLHSRAGPGLLHKYHGRLLLITTGACAVHCRYCFRREFPYSAQHAGTDGWQSAVDYLRDHADVEEVILSGGDPLMLDTRRLAELTSRLTEIPHLKRLRLHTRLPVVLPERIDAELLNWLAELPWSIVLVIHANHAREFDPVVDRALSELRAKGVHLLNQTVLLKGVNDDADTLIELMKRGFNAGVLPYYLHLLDRVNGSAHFEVPEQQAKVLMEALREKLPGYLVPRLVREIAGMLYKLPIL